MPEPSVTYRDIVQGLKDLGVTQKAIIEIHASLSAFGTVHGGANAVIAALMEVVSSEGTIVMSAYPVSPAIPLTKEDRNRGITWKVRKLGINSLERTGMGLIADTFRNRPDVICGSTFNRNCAWGTNAERYCNDYRALLEDGGCCLLLGVGLDRCSSMHIAEKIALPLEIESCWNIPDHVQQAYDPNQWGIGYGGTPGDADKKVWQKADQDGLLRHGKIGSAACHYFKVQPVVDIYAKWRMNDPYGLYEVAQP